MFDVSIILINYNTKNITLQCLESIYEKTADILFDIWVVDNNSQDGSSEAIIEKFPKVNLIQNDRNIGFGSSVNIAIKKSNSKYIFLLNTDTILINNAVKILADFLDNTSDAAGCGGSLYSEQGKFLYSFGNLPRLDNYIFDKLGFSFLHKPCLKNHTEIQKTEHIIGADLMLRRDIFKSINLLDEDFFLYYEELELQYRILKKGLNMYFIPQAEIIHFVGQSCTEMKTKLKYMKDSEYLYFLKTNTKIPKWILKAILSALRIF